MEPQRWQEIDRIFASVLELKPDRRAAFLAKACGDDEELRAEVESLLAHDLPEGLVGGPSVQEASRLLEKMADRKAVSPNTHLGRYKILSQIGSGGMGEVYLARDPKINRDVAIKVLPAAFSSDPERNNYVVSGDGQRFLINSTIDETDAPINVVVNWTANLKR